MESAYYSLTPINPRPSSTNSKSARILGLPPPPKFAPPPPPLDAEEPPLPPPSPTPPLPSRHAPPPPPIPPPPPNPEPVQKPRLILKAEAEFDYEAEQDDELSFFEGDIILVHNKTIYDGWALGEKDGKKGVFPNNFVNFFEEEEVEKVEPGPRKTSVPSPEVARGAPAPSSGPPVGPPTGFPAPHSGTSTGPFKGKPAGPPTSVPSVSPTTGPPTTGPPTTGPPSTGPPSKGPSSSVQPGVSMCKESLLDPEEERTDRSGSVAARAAFLSGALQKSGARAGAPSLPRKMSPNLQRNFADDDKPKTVSKGLTAEELRNFALEHKDEFKPLKKTGLDGKRKPAPPETIISPADVRTKISSSRRRESMDPEQFKRPEKSDITISDPISPPPSTTPPPSKVSLAAVVEPPKPPSSSAVERRPLPAAPVVKPARANEVDGALMAPSSKPPLPEISDTAVSDTSDMYMFMDLNDNDVIASLKNRIDDLEAANIRLQSQVDDLEGNKGSSSAGSSVSPEEVSAIISRLESAESVTAKTNKLISLLQSDLDEEINTRKQLETEVTKLRRTVKLLQG